MRLVLTILLAASVAFAQQKNFLACPIVRDTKTVPCFLAEYEGETYFLGIQQDITAEFHPPQLKHEVLVEGRVKPGPRVCGGIPLEPLTISVIKEVNLACNTLLPPEPGIEAPPAPRGPGPSSRRPEPAKPARAPLTGPQTFTVPFSFDDSQLDYGAQAVLNEAVGYAKRNNGAKVTVTGFRSSTTLSNGKNLVEKADLAAKREQNVATLLRGLGVNLSIEKDARASDPFEGSAGRRVTIRVTP